MNTTYEPWDIETGNVVGSFTRRKDALAVVETLLRSFGSAYAREITLGRCDGTGAPAGEEPEPAQGARVTASS